MSKVLERQPAVITTFALSDLMALSEGGYPNEPVTLVAEPIHRGRNGRECHWGHFCYAKAGVSRRKSVMPLRLLSNHQGLSILSIPNKFAIFVGNKSFQIVPKQKDAMNTLISGMGVPCTGTLRASVLSDS